MVILFILHMHQIPPQLHKRLVRRFTLLNGIPVTVKQKHTTLREMSVHTYAFYLNTTYISCTLKQNKIDNDMYTKNWLKISCVYIYIYISKEWVRTKMGVIRVQSIKNDTCGAGTPIDT